MYHGVRVTSDGPIYRAGLALLDLDDPGTVLHRTDEWVFGPEAPYEIIGDVGRVVFPCGPTPRHLPPTPRHVTPPPHAPAPPPTPGPGRFSAFCPCTH